MMFRIIYTKLSDSLLSQCGINTTYTPHVGGISNIYTIKQAFTDDFYLFFCSALLYAPLEYLVSAAKDGSIKASGIPPSCPRHSNSILYTILGLELSPAQ